MSDRPTGANGKRSLAWGTTHPCPACGECLCFACHPYGPCVDEMEAGAIVGSSPQTDGTAMARASLLGHSAERAPGADRPPPGEKHSVAPAADSVER
jgi:hypothetical protein